MKRRIRFLANSGLVDAEAWELDPALDYIRHDLGLTGTKEGCREGDCGACAVLVGRREAGSFSYRAMPSCLLVLGELEGAHLVTIEGLARGGVPARAKPEDLLSPVMAAIAEANGSQCGFCSPGFVVSLTAYLINGAPLSVEGAAAALEGNLCRCTGYGAIKRAAERLIAEYAGLPTEPLARLEALVSAGVLPPSCATFAKGDFPELEAGSPPEARTAGGGSPAGGARPLYLGGGSDYLVRNPEPDEGAVGRPLLLDRRREFKALRWAEGPGGRTLEIGAALSWREFFSSPEVRGLAPGIESAEGLLASPLVRERATLGGNIVNASPVGDLTSMLIALGARVRLSGAPVGAAASREIPLEKFFLGYKKLDLAPGECLSEVVLPAGPGERRFNFEKASKRETLDIAAVNTAALFVVAGGTGGDRYRITRARLSAGGVAPVPELLAGASAYLEGKEVSAETALEASRLAAAEVSPIGDVRGSADYRRRILARLVLGHFIRLFPGRGVEEAVS